MRKNILLTGEPKSGKSYLLRKIITEIPQKVGFVTEEIRENGSRVGAEMITSTGSRATLAHINLKSEIAVGKYHVDVTALDHILPCVQSYKSEDLLFIDEIGQMQLHSVDFKTHTQNVLDSKNITLSTISKIYKDTFTETVKKRDDVILIELTPGTRVQSEIFVKILIQKIEKAKKYAADPTRFKKQGSNIIVTSDHGGKVLVQKDSKWTCNCDYFQKYNLCSHVLAYEEIGLTSKLQHK